MCIYTLKHGEGVCVVSTHRLRCYRVYICVFVVLCLVGKGSRAHEFVCTLFRWKSTSLNSQLTTRSMGENLFCVNLMFVSVILMSERGSQLYALSSWYIYMYVHLWNVGCSSVSFFGYGDATAKKMLSPLVSRFCGAVC